MLNTLLLVGQRTLIAALLVLAACAPAAPPSPTAPPAKPVAEKPAPQPTAPAAKPTEKPAATAAAEKPAAKPTEKPAAKPAFDEKAVADFYKGKTVKIIVAFPAGGGFDITGRLAAKHMTRYVPGNPTFIVENMPGAASLLAANHVYNVAPKDGTVIGVVNGGATVVEQLFGGQGVQYDATRMQYLGAPYIFTYVLISGKAAGVAKFEEIMGPSGKELLIGASAPGSATHDAPLLLREAVGGNMKVVPGYGGTAPILLAIERGEVQAFFNPWESTRSTIAEKVKSGELVLLGQFSDKPHKDLPNVPEFVKMARTDEQRQLLRLGIVVPGQFSFQVFLAPGVPADRVKALEAAFATTMQDKEFLADSEKANTETTPLTGEQLLKLTVDFLGMPADIKAKLQKVMRP